MTSLDSTEIDEDSNDYEKPLSPVLKQSKVNRKVLIGRRVHSKRARVKLLNNFEEADRLSKATSDISTGISPLNSFTESQTLMILECEDQVKQQEKYDSGGGKNKFISNISEPSCFKKPISPAPHAKKIAEHQKKHGATCNPLINVGNSSNQILPSIEKSSFQTASGKDINMCRKALREHSKLFEDILIPAAVMADNIRKNKHSFLCKTDNRIDINNSSRTLIQAEHTEIKKQLDVNSDNEDFGLFTQLITDSGISNTQIGSLCEDVLNNSFHGTVTTSSTLKPKTVFSGSSVDTAREKQLLQNAELALEAANSLCKTTEHKLVGRCDNFQDESSEGFKGFSQICIAKSQKVTKKLGNIVDSIFNKTEGNNIANTQKYSSERTIFSVNSRLPVPSSHSNSVKIEIIRSPPSKKTRIHTLSESETMSSCLDSSSLYSSKTSCGDGMLRHNTMQRNSPRLGENMKISESSGNAVVTNMNHKCMITVQEHEHCSGEDAKSEHHKNLSEQTLTGAGEIFGMKNIDAPHTVENMKIMLPFIKNQQISKPPSTIFCSGFQTASGNKVKISEKLLEGATKMFESCNTSETENVIMSEKCQLSPSNQNFSFMKANVNSHKNTSNTVTSFGFKTASGSTVHVSEKMLKIAENMLESCSTDIPSEDSCKDQTEFLSMFQSRPQQCHTPFTKNARNSSTISSSRSHTELEEEGEASFKTALGSNINISTRSLDRAKRLFNDGSVSLKPDFSPLCSAIPNDFPSNMNTGVFAANESTETSIISSSNSSNNSGKTYNNSTSLKPKKRLGVSSCKQISLSEGQLNNAKSFFKEDLFSVMSFSKPHVAMKLTETVTKQSTPIKQNISHNISSFVDSTITPIRSPNIASFIDSTITPIRESGTRLSINQEEEDCQVYTNAPVLIQKPTDGNIDKWMEDLEHEKCLLQKKLEILLQRSIALREQKHFLGHTTADRMRKRLGVLSRKKLSKSRLKWLDFVKDQTPGNVASTEIPNRLLEINPQNAEFVHFNCLTGGIEGVITTDDKAVLVPNTKNLIGLTEIKSAFKVMPGVEAKLIPNGWIRNHYKWVVWKLASYERSFPEQCKGCFTLENVIQQLKYRYDREIDKAERPALRKIYEKDDVPQKRMVVCVCDILKLSDRKYDLVLTDGWYSIRTTIDEPLCQQIENRKIQVGTKLITHCAELFNCDGCYPLEATDMVHLRIFFNCTRRVRWYSKLGYYSISIPFPIPIETISPLGGIVAHIKVYIARIYPIRYMERKCNATVWRNARAEERRVQEWENERLKKIDDLHDQARSECEVDLTPKDASGLQQSTLKLKDITCPQTLYYMIKHSKDPEYIQGELTQSQRKAILKYQESITLTRQQQMSSKISENLQKLKQLKRDVLPIMKMVVLDICNPTSHGVSLYIWNPTESHMQMLKEGKSFAVYNVTPKRNGDLSTNMKTKFESLSNSKVYGDRITRSVTPIASLTKWERNLFLNEFDTVGIVVQIKVQNASQELWLSDLDRWLLYVKISEGPATCLLLDNVKRGQIICCSNLVLCQGNNATAQAVANHFTIFTCYPQQKHLQEALDLFKKQCPKDASEILSYCDIKIGESINSLSTKPLPDMCSESISVLDDTEDSTLIYSRITSTDIAMSMIDIDQFK